VGKRSLALATAMFGSALLAVQADAGPVTFVDAVGGLGGNTVRASNESPDDWFTTAAANDNLWYFRGDQGNAGIFQSSDSNTYSEDAPELKTTVTGIANALYDVYVFFRSEAGANDWKVRAGFTSNPGANPVYARTSAGGATAGSLALSGINALTWNGSPPVEDNPQLLYYAVIGQFNVTSNTLSVFIDDLPVTGATPLNTRTWYEGIGYAIPSVTLEINSAMTGNAQTPATWNNNQSPVAGNNYNVLASHTVTVDSPFPGNRLVAKVGGTLNVAAPVDIRYLKVEAGGNVTMTGAGDLKIGDELAAVTLGFFETAQDLTFNMNPGSDFIMAMSLLGTGNITYNSNGPGSELILPDAQAYGGTTKFQGTGDGVRIVSNRSSGRVEMSSTGANVLTYETNGQITGGTHIFHQPGAIVHATNNPGSRLINPTILEANAAVTVDLSAPYATDERRLLYGDGIRGAGDITVVGTASDPSNPAGGSNGTTRNEFELGGSTEPDNIQSNTYSGTLTANGYVNVELRRSLPAAKIVVNNNALFDMGHQVVGTTKSIRFGEVVVNSGGILEVGYEQSIAGFETGRHVGNLQLVNTDGRAGSLTLSAGARTVMQVNGTAAGQFDTIVAQGGVTLGGTLEVVVNPLSSTGTNSTYAPTLGDVITLITAGGGGSLATDFNGNGTVDAADLDTWKTAYGSTNLGDANGDGVTDGADFLAWQRDLGLSSGGGLTGTFSSLVVTDPDNVMSGAGLKFQMNVTSSNVQLVVVAASAVAAVPEPAAVSLLALGAGLFVRRRR
jgi:hypothetical protein